MRSTAGTDESTLAAARLRLVVARLSRRMRQAWNPPSDMTVAQSSALVSVDRLGPITLGRLAETEQVQPPTMTRIVESLVEKGLLARARDADDRRAVQVTTTSRGRRVLDQCWKRRDRFLSERISQLSATERSAVVRALP